MNKYEWSEILQGVLVALIAASILSVIVAQIYKYGQRNPDMAHYVPYEDCLTYEQLSSKLIQASYKAGYKEGFNDGWRASARRAARHD